MVDTWTGPKSGARYNEYLASQKYGQAYTPGQGAGTALKQYTTAQEDAAKVAQAKTDATRLEEINKRLAPVYNPLTELIGTQKKAAESRYATNQADVKTIFGALSKVADADRIRIDKQFTDSIAKQQMDLAARTAQQRSETAAGVAQAQATGAERGAGPEMAVNPISVAAEQGISNANAIMSNWQGLMQANQAQAQIDVNNRQTGYGQQQVGALATLSKNFEATMADLGTQEAQLKSQIAQATAAAQEAYRQGDAETAAAAAKAAETYNLQLLKNQGSQNVANTQAQAKLQGIQMQQQGASARAAASGSGGTTKKYSKDIYGFQQRVGTELRDANAFNNIADSVDQAVTLATRRKLAGVSKTDAQLGVKAKAPTNAEILSAWKSLGGGGKYLTYVQDYLKNYYSK